MLMLFMNIDVAVQIISCCSVNSFECVRKVYQDVHKITWWALTSNVLISVSIKGAVKFNGSQDLVLGKFQLSTVILAP